MSYFVIRGPAENGQYLGATVIDGTDFGCPQWRGTRTQAQRFPDADSAWKWLDAVQKRHPDAWYQGRVVRVNTVKDRLAEIARLRAWTDELRTENSHLRAEAERLRKQAATVAAVEVKGNAVQQPLGGHDDCG